MRKEIEWLKHEMQRRNLNQKGLAKDMGVSEGQVSRYLRELATPRPDTLIRLAKRWGISEKEVLQIFGYDEELKLLRERTSIPKKEIGSREELIERILKLSDAFPTVMLHRTFDLLENLSTDELKDLLEAMEFYVERIMKRGTERKNK